MQRRTVIMSQIEREFLRKGDFAECENDFGYRVAGADVNKQPRKSVFDRLGSITKPRSTDGGLPRDRPMVCTRRDRIKGFRKSGPVNKMKKRRLITVRMSETKHEEPRHQACDNTSTVIFEGTSESRIELDTLHAFKLNKNNPKFDDDRNVQGSKCLVELNCDGSKVEDKLEIEGSTVDDELNIDVSKIDNELHIDGSKIDGLNIGGSEASDEDEYQKCSLALCTGLDPDTLLIQRIDAFLEDRIPLDSKIDEYVLEIESCDNTSDSDTVCGGSGSGSQTDKYIDDKASTSALNKDGFNLDIETNLVCCPFSQYNGSDPDTYLLNMLDAFLEQDDVDKTNFNKSTQNIDLNYCEPKLSCKFPPRKRTASAMSDDSEDLVPAIKRHKVNTGETCLHPPRKRKISPDRNDSTSSDKYTRFS